MSGHKFTNRAKFRAKRVDNLEWVYGFFHGLSSGYDGSDGSDETGEIFPKIF